MKNLVAVHVGGLNCVPLKITPIEKRGEKRGDFAGLSGSSSKRRGGVTSCHLVKWRA